MLLKVIKEYGIKANIECFIYNNASSNDAAVKLLFKELEPSISNTNITGRRLQYFRHVYNLTT